MANAPLHSQARGLLAIWQRLEKRPIAGLVVLDLTDTYQILTQK
jgi:hypothetical protein